MDHEGGHDPAKKAYDEKMQEAFAGKGGYGAGPPCCLDHSWCLETGNDGPLRTRRYMEIQVCESINNGIGGIGCIHEAERPIATKFS